MKTTVSALYASRADAELALASLKTHGLDGHAEIHDKDGPGAGGWLHGFLGGHSDAHVYHEGLERGHVLLTVQVEDPKATLAAELIEAAAQPMDLGEREKTFRSEGWKPDTKTYPGPDLPLLQAATSFGAETRVRSYVRTNTVD
jgi:hypothetical protein